MFPPPASSRVLNEALHSVKGFPFADGPIVLQRRTTGHDSFVVQSGEDSFGAILVNRQPTTRIARRFAINRIEEIDNVHGFRLHLLDPSRNLVPRVTQHAELLNQRFHLATQTGSMLNADAAAGNSSHTSEILAQVTIVTHRSIEALAVIPRPNNHAGEDIVSRSENRLAMLVRRHNRKIVTVVEITTNLTDTAKGFRRGFNQSQNIVGRVGDVTSGHATIADRFLVVRTEQTIPSGLHVIRPGQRELFNRKVEGVLDRLDDVAANDTHCTVS